MSQLPIPITLVRWDSRDASRLLQQFVFGGEYGSRNPPRGIDPEYVSYWLTQNLAPTADATALARTLDLLRFYERPDVLPHLARFLTRNEQAPPSFLRSLQVVACIGELGTVEQSRAASGYFTQYLLPRPEAMTFFPSLLDAADSLAVTLDIAGVGRRLQTAIDEAAKVPDRKGPAGAPFRTYTNYAGTSYRDAVRHVEAKRRLLATDPSQRLHELIQIYLGLTPLSATSIQIFAARLVRAYARNGGQAPVNTALSQFFDATARSQTPQPRRDFLLHRTAQALLYLGGKLTFPQEAIYDKLNIRSANFLWDDVG